MNVRNTRLPALALAAALLAACSGKHAKDSDAAGTDSAHGGSSASTGAAAEAKSGDSAESGTETASGNDEDAAPPPVVGAKTAQATVQRFVETLTAIGVVVPRPGRYAELSPPAPTRVTRIYVSPGDAVTTGAPLVEFDRAPFDAEAASTAASLTAAEHAYDRAQRLAAAGILPRKDVDQAAADLAQARTADINARRAQELSIVRAPIDGVVTHVSAVLGASVDPSQVVVGVADPHALDILLSLSPSDGARVRSGDSVVVTAGQGPQGEPLGTGVVSSVGLAIDTASRTLGVRARLAHPVRALRIGETVSGQITTGVVQRAVTIPVQALVPEGDGQKVFVVGKDGLAHARDVTVGAHTETVAEISEGLKPGETVVTEGAYGVEDSAKVVPVK
jgi:RND family efflux transporter MFP subunit